MTGPYAYVCSQNAAVMSKFINNFGTFNSNRTCRNKAATLPCSSSEKIEYKDQLLLQYTNMQLKRNVNMQKVLANLDLLFFHFAQRNYGHEKKSKDTHRVYSSTLL